MFKKDVQVCKLNGFDVLKHFFSMSKSNEYLAYYIASTSSRNTSSDEHKDGFNV